MSDDERLIRWHAVVHYRTENGTPEVEHDLEELVNCTRIKVLHIWKFLHCLRHHTVCDYYYGAFFARRAKRGG